MRRVVALCLLFCLPLSLAPRPAAAGCPPIAGGDAALADVDPVERVAFIQDGLHAGVRKARLWAWGWTGAHVAMAVGQLALLPAFPKESWIDRYIGSAASLVGIASLWLAPLHILRDSPKLDKAIAAAGDLKAPGTTDEARCALLREAESLLLRDAANEDRVSAWWPHAATLAFGLGLGLALSLGFDRKEQGALLGIASMTIGEVRLGTQPTDSVKLLRRYRSGSLRAPPEPARPWWTIAPSIIPPTGPASSGGFGLSALVVY